MSIDKSLRRKNSLLRARSVLTRGERIKVLMNEERWQDGRSPFALPKVRVMKIAKKPKKAPKALSPLPKLHRPHPTRRPQPKRGPQPKRSPPTRRSRSNPLHKKPT